MPTYAVGLSGGAEGFAAMSGGVGEWGRCRNRFTAAEVKSVSEVGRHADGGGLYLVVKPTGARAWAFMWKARGRRREMGLGPFPAVSLAKARTVAERHRAAIAEGRDPLAERKGVEAKASEPTFAEASDTFIASMEAGWRNPKHRQQWRNTLATYCEPIADRPVSEVDTDAVLKVLQPIWVAKPETASRVRGRIERVLDYARARGWRSGANPALWRGHLSAILPARARLTKGHHAAMPYRDVPRFVWALRTRQGLAARALEFAVLTAARSGEVRGASWSEIDLAEALWTIPAARMKGGREHRVPLSEAALAILEGLGTAAEGSGLVFPGARGQPLSDMSLSAVLRRMKLDDFTVHGFRSSFRDWCAETTSVASEVAEMALAHAVGNKVEAAYRRGDLFDKRRELMAAWAAFCGGSR